MATTNINDNALYCLFFLCIDRLLKNETFFGYFKKITQVGYIEVLKQKIGITLRHRSTLIKFKAITRFYLFWQDPAA